MRGSPRDLQQFFPVFISFGGPLCADLRAICIVFATIYELRRSSGTWFGGPLCADLRAICTIRIVFNIIFELRRSSGTWDFIILNKGLMRPPRRKKAKGSHAQHRVQNFSPIFPRAPVCLGSDSHSGNSTKTLLPTRTSLSQTGASLSPI